MKHFAFETQRQTSSTSKVHLTGEQNFLEPILLMKEDDILKITQNHNWKNTMESKKRPLTNNNSYSMKKPRLSSSIQLEDLCELGIDILSDESGSDESDIYNECDRKISEEFLETKKIQLMPVSDLTYRRRSADDGNVKTDKFECLPDEMVMGILRYLNKKSLVALSMTSRRLNRLCRDEALWSRLNLTSKKLEVDNIGHILLTGVKVLRLNSVIFPTPILTQGLSAKLENYVAKVKYLDLSYAWINVDDLALMLNCTRHLLKLSLESVNVNLNVVKAIVANKDLDTLNLAMATGLNEECMSLLLKNLCKLESLNLAWTGLSAPGYYTVCKEISPSIKHLDLSGSHVALKTEALICLTKRCSSLESFDISECISLSVGTLRDIIKTQQNLRMLGISRCYQIDVPALEELKNSPKLELLAAYRLIPNSQLDEVRAMFPYVKVNKNPLSVIARPTVGIRRTSIWEQPTSD